MLRSIIFVHMSKYIYATEFILGFQFTYFTNKGKKNFLRLQMSAICPLDGLLTKLYMYTCKTLEPCSM